MSSSSRLNDDDAMVLLAGHRYATIHLVVLAHTDTSFAPPPPPLVLLSRNKNTDFVGQTPQNTPLSNAPLTREALSRPTVGTIGEEDEGVSGS